MTVLFWNSTFGMADDLQYSTKVEYALRRLRPFVELKLPGLVESIEIDVSLCCSQRQLAIITR